MAGGQERILRRRIKTVESTKKITRAMELISASQIVRAQGRIAGSKPYLRGIEDVTRETAADSPNSPLLGVPESPSNVLILAIVSDRGLCGGYNNGILRATERLIRSGSAEGREHRVITVGRKAEAYFRFRHQPIERSYRQMSDRPTYEDARAVAESIVPPFMAGEVDLVEVVSWRFVSSGSQVVETRQVLPILPAEAVSAEVKSPRRAEQRGDAGGPDGGASGADGPGRDGAGADAGGEAGGMDLYASAPATRAGFFEFEPEAEDLLSVLVPRYAEAMVYGALLEASASEHTARQRAMSAATENADELIKTLRRTMNRARQDSITTEIMEIVGGAEALRTASHPDSGPTDRDNAGQDPEEQIA
jgi:F-type H+-transporting ATPase subunit gamma